MDLVHYQSSKKTVNLTDRLTASGLSDRTFAIYGIGAVASMLARLLSGFKIAGLMDKDPANIGKEIYGLRVLSYQEVIDSVDAVIIAASDVYWDTIFRRISFLKDEHGKEIFFTDGQPAHSNRIVTPMSENPCWTACRDDLLLEVDRHAIVSFDVFDTLICRKLARPDDLLSVVAERAHRLLAPGTSFIRMRKEAEEYCRTNIDPHFDIDQLYQTLGDRFEVNRETVEKLKELEIEAEVEFSAPRPEMIDLYNHAMRNSKTVYLISDFHLPTATLQRILLKAGINGYSGLFVSCSEKKSKRSGALWEQFQGLTGSRTHLHIGDDDIADITKPAALGIHTGKVMSCGEMLLASSIRDVAVHVESLQDSTMMGLVQRHLFNSPFALHKTRGVPEINTLFSFGYLFFGPLLFNYFAWLLPQLQNGSFERILFLAREGYLLDQLYVRIVKTLRLENLPRGVYFKTSRRMASVASLKTKDDILRTMKDSFSGTVQELLLHRFGVSCDPVNGQETVVNTDRKIREIIDRHAGAILAKAAEEREAYLSYIRGLGLKTQSRLAIGDIGLKGSIQHYLGGFFPADYTGFYVTAFTGIWNPYGLSESVKALYPESASEKECSSNVFKFHIMFESALAAPEGMYVKANPDGSFVNGPRLSNQKQFDKKREIHAGIEAFIFDMLELNGNTLVPPANQALVDKLYGLPMSGTCIIADQIKETFFVDDCFGVVNEKKIWD